MPEEDPTILDHTVIESLRELDPEGECGLLSELVDLFLSDTPPRMKDLESALASGDAKTVEEVAHSLKSSCGNLGAARLATLFKEIEAFGRGKDLAEVPSLVDRSNDEFRRVEEALKAEVS